MFKHNNFDLIRLFASVQVAVVHAAENFGIALHPYSPFNFFPGVPIFFFISGYLIYQSYTNLGPDKIYEFFWNRFLRIYPALFVVFFFSIVLLFLTGYLSLGSHSILELIVWLLAQLTFLQFYNPEFLREFGNGVVNGSLWTISVEIQFYIIVPFLFIAVTQLRKSFIFFILLFFIILNFLNNFYNDYSSIPLKLFGVSFLPWFYMFMLGAIASANPVIINFVKATNLFFIIILYFLSIYILSFFGFGVGNGINVLSFTFLGALVLKLAFVHPFLSNGFLKGNDFSYGIYIYHMPIINSISYYYNFPSHISFMLFLLGTLIMAFLSWYLIEKPALKLKNFSFR